MATATALLGMDTEQVSAMGRQLVRDADAMDQLVVNVRQLVGGLGSSWRGPDFEQFHAAWESVHSPALGAIADGLRRHGQTALAQAQQQEQASAAVGPAGASPGWAAGPLGGMAPVGTPLGVPTRPTDRDLALLAESSYSVTGVPPGLSGSYHRLTPAELTTLGIDPASLNTPQSGFAAAIYQGADGTYVLAYRGTDFKTVEDWSTNVAGGVGLSGQSVQAVQLAQQLKQSVGAENITITGHSLGGRLASVGSIATGIPAVTWNSAGVSDAEFAYALHAGGQPSHVVAVLGKYGAIAAAPMSGLTLSHFDPFSAERAALAQGQIRAFYVPGEPLSTIQDNSAGLMPAPLGTRIQMAAPGSDVGFMDKHGMAAVEKSYDATVAAGGR